METELREAVCESHYAGGKIHHSLGELEQAIFERGWKWRVDNACFLRQWIAKVRREDGETFKAEIFWEDGGKFDVLLAAYRMALGEFWVL